MAGIFDFFQMVYGIFGMKFKLELSTRPEKFLGEIATWDAAEAVSSPSPSLLLGALIFGRSN
jgi:threonyl-tRNA synthetase